MRRKASAEAGVSAVARPSAGTREEAAGTPAAMAAEAITITEQNDVAACQRLLVRSRFRRDQTGSPIIDDQLAVVFT